MFAREAGTTRSHLHTRRGGIYTHASMQLQACNLIQSRGVTMALYDEMRVELQELVDLVQQDERYASAVAHGAIHADQETAETQRRRATRIVELKRRYGLS